MELFNFKNIKNKAVEVYRDKLASDLKEIKKEDPEKAHEFLNEKKDSMLYKIADEHQAENRERIRIKNIEGKKFYNQKYLKNTEASRLPYGSKEMFSFINYELLGKPEIINILEDKKFKRWISQNNMRKDIKSIVEYVRHTYSPTHYFPSGDYINYLKIKDNKDPDSSDMRKFFKHEFTLYLLPGSEHLVDTIGSGYYQKCFQVFQWIPSGFKDKIGVWWKETTDIFEGGPNIKVILFKKEFSEKEKQVDS